MANSANADSMGDGVNEEVKGAIKDYADKLKKAGYWIVALDGDSNTTLTQLPKNTPLCIVVGSEGYGISRLVKENCDIIAKIPMYGKVNCLNASLACGIALYSIRNL